MKCLKCGGKGFIELEHGLIQVSCPDCISGEIKVVPEATFTGILFQLAGKRTDEFDIDELWKMAKETTIKITKFPYSQTMPCGNARLFESPSDIRDLPIADIPCSCGNPQHYIVRFIDMREGEDGNSGTGPDNQPTGSEAAGKPKQSRKPKARKKTTKRPS